MYFNGFYSEERLFRKHNSQRPIERTTGGGSTSIPFSVSTWWTGGDEKDSHRLQSYPRGMIERGKDPH